jgi:hypothetical protein
VSSTGLQTEPTHDERVNKQNTREDAEELLTASRCFVFRKRPPYSSAVIPTVTPRAAVFRGLRNRDGEVE